MTNIAVRPVHAAAQIKHLKRLEADSIGIMREQALDRYAFDAEFGGTRRDEERSHARERIFSVRNAERGWNPKNQRPELWWLFKTPLHDGESMRVFPP